MPKELGSLGMRGMWETNIALLLIWILNTRPDNLWVQTIISKYCRGRNFLDDLPKPTSCSWIWQCIMMWKYSFLNGACCLVKKSSSLQIREDPWIPKSPKFKLPSDVKILGDMRYVKELMNSNGRSWNVQLINNLMPTMLARSICKIHLLVEPEQDEFF